MIEITDLSKRYGSTQAIAGVSLRAEPGRVTALLGPNGAGKSTTLRILLGLDRSDSGTALIDGVAYRERRAPLWHVGAQFDGSGAHRGRTGRAHLTWVAQSNGIPRTRIRTVIDAVGLTGADRRRVATYSLGMGQRLGIATAMLGDPRVVVLDEPTNGLDPDGIRWVRRMVRTLADEGRLVLLSSHLMGEVEQVADHVVVIAHGQVVRAGGIAEITEGFANLETAYFALTGQTEPDAQ